LIREPVIRCARPTRACQRIQDNALYVTELLQLPACGGTTRRKKKSEKNKKVLTRFWRFG
jgi:hypothetical protein